MQAEFWLQCWRNNQLGFQLEQVHPLLQQCLAFYQQPASVFVPLCGKSLDMLYLAQFMAVTGSELSPIACGDFFEEHQLPYTITKSGDFCCYNSHAVALWQGDFFNLGTAQLAACRFIYDRAALIALPAAMRLQYVRHLKSVFSAGTEILLISLEYPEHEKAGPPFNVDEAEIRRLFYQDHIQLLAEHDLTGKGFAKRRFTTSHLIEKAWYIRLCA